MGTVFFVFTDTFYELGVGVQIEGYGHCPGFSVCLRIVERNLDIHMSEVAAPEAFGDAQGLAVRMSRIVEPALIVETDGLGDQRIAFPLANGISEPAFSGFRRKAA